MTLYAMLSRDRQCVLCRRCRAMLGGLVDSAGRQVYTVGGPALENVAPEPRVLTLIPGYFCDPAVGIWRLTNHARKRLSRGQRPRFSHGTGGLGVVDYPLIVQCWNCLIECTVDRRRLGF